VGLTSRTDSIPVPGTSDIKSFLFREAEAVDKVLVGSLLFARAQLSTRYLASESPAGVSARALRS